MNELNWNFPYPSRRMPVFAKNVVAASQPLAVQAGLKMLAAGGNAVDAALAAAITLTVVEPTGNGLGSDAFALVWNGGELSGLNGSGRSPKAWNLKRFEGLKEMPLTGWDTVTVPGAVDAWARLSERFGLLTFAELFEPAIRYARYGFPLSPVISNAWKQGAEHYRHMAEFRRIFLPADRPPEPGERFSCHPLALSLESIAETRGEAFYRGRLAEQMAACAEAEGGAMTQEDLAAHRSDWVKPVATAYRNVRVHEIPPNGQGLAALVALGILNRFRLSELEPDGTEAFHLQIEAMKIGFAVAKAHIADPESMRRDPSDFLNGDFLDGKAGTVCRDRAAAPVEPYPDRGTVYLTAADESGMMVSYIQSNFTGFGSGVVVPDTGISLQNRGRGFCLTPGHPNCVDGGKRPYHTIIPGFITRNGDALMSFGVMGGHMQPQGHVQMTVRVTDFHQNPQAASDAPRWHICEDGTVALEAGVPDAVKEGLKDRGHRIAEEPPCWGYGGAQLIYRMPCGYCAASDHRKDGCASGF